MAPNNRPKPAANANPDAESPDMPDVNVDAAETERREAKAADEKLAELCKQHPLAKCTAHSVVLCHDVALGSGDRPSGTFLGYLALAPGIDPAELTNALRNMNMVTCTPI